MNKTLKTAALLLITFLAFNSVQAASNAAKEPAQNSSSGTGTSVKEVIKHDAKATGQAVKHAAKATARVVKQGAKAVANGVKHGTKAVGKGIKHENDATDKTADRQGN